MSKKIIIIFIITLIAIIVTVVSVSYFNNKGHDNFSAEKNYGIIKVYKSPTCGCCNGYVSALKNSSFKVEAINLEDLNSIKNHYNIPSNMQSCHTTIIGKYFIEGHVPLEVVQKLLNEQPDIDGIALPGMPTGTPGMPGHRDSPLIIYQLKSGEYSEYMILK